MGTQNMCVSISPNGLNRVVQTWDALGQTNFTVYHGDGQVFHQWGANTYPVQYELDLWGRLCRMTTYRDLELISGDRTIWARDDVTGLPTNKFAGGFHVFTYATPDYPPFWR